MNERERIGERELGELARWVSADYNLLMDCSFKPGFERQERGHESSSIDNAYRLDNAIEEGDETTSV